MSDLTCLLTFNDQEVAQLQDSELKGEATRQRAWAIELHKAWLAPLGLAFGINDSLWALGQVRQGVDFIFTCQTAWNLRAKNSKQS